MIENKMLKKRLEKKLFQNKVKDKGNFEELIRNNKKKIAVKMHRKQRITKLRSVFTV